MKLLFSIILLFGSSSNLSNGIINDESTKLLADPWANSEVISVLKKGTKLDIISYDDKYSVTGNYVGKWCRIKTNNVQGYVMSCFISSELFKDEIFHDFHNRLLLSIEKNIIDLSLVNNNIIYIQASCRSDTISKIIDKNDFNLSYLKFITSKEAVNKKITYKSDFVENYIEMYYSIDGGYYTIYSVKLIDKKWKIFKIYIGNC
jgi:hypothetical protein